MPNRKNKKQEDYNSEDISALLGKIDALVQTSGNQNDITSKTTSLSQVRADEFKDQGFAEAQLMEIQKGIDQKLPTALYAKQCYNWMQMREIRRGLLKDLDVSLYDDPMYSADQMREIRLGLMEHLDVSSYAQKILSSSDMRRIRKTIFDESYQHNPSGFGWTIINSETDIQLRVSADCMKAFVTLPQDFQRELTEKELLDLLEEYEILYGIIPEKIKEIVEKRPLGEEICIAHGRHPADGKPGYFELFFDNAIENGHTVPPEGDIDYTDVNVIDAVRPGDMLIKYHPAPKTLEGMTVTGITVSGKPGEDLPALSGNGIRYDAENNIYFATQKGYASYDAMTSSLNVWNIYEIHGDISYFQNTEYDGTVHVFGSVKNSTVIRAKGDIIIDGFVENSTLVSHENIVIKGGVNGGGQGLIQAGGSIRGRFFEYATIQAGGLVEGSYFLQCNIVTDDQLFVRGRKGRVMGGRINAVIGLDAVLLGNYLSNKTLCNVGDTSTVEKRIITLEHKKNGILEELQQLELGKEKLVMLLGEAVAPKNALYKKTSLALELKENQLAECSRDISHLKVVCKRANKAYIRIHGEVQANVTIIFSGNRRRVDKDISHGLLLSKEHPRGAQIFFQQK